jgi:hypothetical protein
MNKYNDAINIVLQTIGEQTLEGDVSIDGIYEAEQADIIIENIKEEILEEGWVFNTDTGWEFTPDVDGYITLPSSILRIDTTEDSNIIRKDGRLYDKDNISYKFTAAVECDVTWAIPFDEMPPVAQRYVALRAARIMYQRFVGDVSMMQVLMNDEQEAKRNLDDYEVDLQDFNVFNNSQTMRIINRTTNPTGIRG